MEPKSQKELDYRDLSFVEASLSFWSKKGIQGFLGSGLAHDFVEAIRSSSFNMENTCKGLKSLEYFGCAYDDEVSLPQALKVISIAPTNNKREWNYFFGLLTTLSANSKYFEKKPFSWEDRDQIRVAIGLQPLNPIYKNGLGQDVIFRRTGHCGIWINPPLGYRYADIDEIQITAIETLDSVLVDSGSGYYRWKKLGVVNNEIRTGDINAVRFFQNNIFFVPIVKN